MKNQTQTLSEVSLSEADGVRYLHLGTEWVQGSMRIRAPFDIELEYVQRMMAWLLFTPPEAVAGGHAMQLGLGAGAITKFCYKKLRMTCTAVEINPRVADVCRAWMRLPPEDERLRVVIADAAAEIQRDEWQATVDALAVDLYDHEAAAPVLDSPDFYADCRRLLTDGGCMSVNLFGRSASYARSLAHIVHAFGEEAVWAFKPTREGSCRGRGLPDLRLRPPSRKRRAAALEERGGKRRKPLSNRVKPFRYFCGASGCGGCQGRGTPLVAGVSPATSGVPLPVAAAGGGESGGKRRKPHRGV